MKFSESRRGCRGGRRRCRLAPWSEVGGVGTASDSLAAVGHGRTSHTHTHRRRRTSVPLHDARRAGAGGGPVRCASSSRRGEKDPLSPYPRLPRRTTAGASFCGPWWCRWAPSFRPSFPGERTGRAGRPDRRALRLMRHERRRPNSGMRRESMTSGPGGIAESGPRKRPAEGPRKPSDRRKHSTSGLRRKRAPRSEKGDTVAPDDRPEEVSRKF